MGTHGASPPAPGPPDLKQVGEIIIESDRQKDPDPLGTEILHGEAIKQGGSPNENRPCHVQLVFLKDDAVIIVDVGISEILAYPVGCHSCCRVGPVTAVEILVRRS